MGKKLFVGNLPYSMSNDQLRELFAPFGETEEITIISDKFSGKSKGFGFVTFKEDADAEKALSELNGKEIDGRPMTVNEAKPMDPNAPRERRSFGGRGGGFGGGRREGGFNRGGGFRRERRY